MAKLTLKISPLSHKSSLLEQLALNGFPVFPNLRINQRGRGHGQPYLAFASLLPCYGLIGSVAFQLELISRTYFSEIG